MLSNDLLWTVPDSIEKVFGLLAMTSTGAQILTRAYPYINQELISFQVYPQALLQELKATRSVGEISGACCVTSKERAVIYFDSGAPIGVTAILFAHELSHALDSSLWACVKAGGDSDSAVQFSERTARQIQKRVTSELFQRFPLFHKKVVTEFSDSRILFPESLDLNASR